MILDIFNLLHSSILNMHFIVNYDLFYEILFVDKQNISMYRYNMKKDVRKYLGLKVRAMREAANMTQEELATICDVSWRTISNLERGTVVPDLFMIYRIAQNFDVKIDELLDHQIINQKSLSRIEKENIIIEKIKRIDDNVLDYIDEQLCLLLKHFNH